MEIAQVDEAARFGLIQGNGKEGLVDTVWDDVGFGRDGVSIFEGGEEKVRGGDDGADAGIDILLEFLKAGLAWTVLREGIGGDFVGLENDGDGGMD